MTMKPLLAALVLGAAALASAGTANAQGIFRGAEEGAARGNRAAGPIGGIVGGGIGAGVGGVKGALGIGPSRRHVHRSHRSRNQRYGR